METIMTENKILNNVEIKDKMQLIICLVHTLCQDIKVHEDKRLKDYVKCGHTDHSELNILESKTSIKNDIVKIRRELLKLSKMFE